MKDERRFNLNPQGRIQTKKLRPTLPVVDVLQSWLGATEEWFVCAEKAVIGVQQDGGLDLRGAKPMAGHVDHVVHSTRDPGVAVQVASASVAGEVGA